MRMQMRTIFVISGLMLALNGCAWHGSNWLGSLWGGSASGFQAVGKSPKVAQLVATDLVMAIVQLDELHGSDVVIQAPLKVSDPFALHAISQLRAAGFNVEQVPVPDASYAMTFASEAKRTLYSVTHRYFLGVGELAVEREYSERNGGVYPRSTLRVMGSDALVQLDDEIFIYQDWRQQFPSGSEASESSQLAVVGRRTDPKFNVVTRMTLDDPTLYNAYMLDKSNYAEFLEDRNLVHQQVVIFPNDSDRLTAGGKKSVDKFMQLFDASSDWIHLMGCSHGRSVLFNGNEELAKRRVLRIAQHLYIAGVSPANVLAEGCWSPQHFDERGHPRRGVMMHIYRKGDAITSAKG